MAAVSPAKPVPRITVSRTEFSIASIRFVTFDFSFSPSSGLFLPGGGAGRAGLGGLRCIDPVDVTAKRVAQGHGFAIFGHDVSCLVKQRLVGVLVLFRAACEHNGGLAETLQAYARYRRVHAENAGCGHRARCYAVFQ